MAPAPSERGAPAVARGHDLAVRAEERVDLRREVVLKQRKPDGRFVELNTTQMYVYPDRKFAESDQAVIIATHTGRSNAVGFEGDLEKNWMRLHSSPDQRVHIVVYADSQADGAR